MKVPVIFVGIILFSLLTNSCLAVGLIGARMYIEKLAKRVVEMLETRYISGSDFPLDDYVASLNITSYGIRTAGNVSFHSAFVAKIGSMELNMQKYTERLLNTEASVEAVMLWRNVGIVVDFFADLEGYQGSGTFLITFGQFEIPLMVRKVFETDEVSGSLAFMSINSQNDIVVVAHPNDAQVQMIARGFRTVFAFRDHMLESVRRWNFQNILNAALTDVPFPEMCYIC